jgi:hypothetical protein
MQQEIAYTPPAACTSACAIDAESVDAGAADAVSLQTPVQAVEPLSTDPSNNDLTPSTAVPDDPLAKLAAAIAVLTPAERTRLAGLLGRYQDDG